jgi:hypothetical protein
VSKINHTTLIINSFNNPNMTPRGAIKMIIFGSIAAGTALIFTMTFG